MPFNGSGTFNRVYDWTDDRDNGVKIQADRMDTEMDGMATGLSTCLTKDGQTTPTANIPMGGYRITNLGDASARTDASTAGDLQDGDLTYQGNDTGSADAYAIALSPAITAYVAGMTVTFVAANANTGSSTINVNAVGAKNIFFRGEALKGGEIATGQPITLTYDGTQFNLMSMADALSPSAWIQFVGSGTATINADYNVSSITDNGTGDFTITFSTAMSSDNYAFAGSSGTDAAGSPLGQGRTVTAYDVTPTSIKIGVNQTDNTAVDDANTCLIIFGG